MDEKTYSVALSRPPPRPYLQAVISAWLIATLILIARPNCAEKTTSAVEWHLSTCGHGRVNDEFDWNTLHPNVELDWQPCYDNEHECTRLQVPLDYHDPDAGYAAIAMLRIPAKKQGVDYKGPILFNPGGPGDVATTWILRRGKLLQKIVGEEYDIVGFDPRGVGFTTPILNAFNNDLERDSWLLQRLNDPYINDTSHSLANIMAQAKLYNAKLAEKSADIVKHANTPIVCRDMLHIVEAHGFGKLQFWGFSYGSVLGASFATLYPDKVGRVILDGVFDFDDYYKGIWGNNLVNADKGFRTVFKQCSASGKHCALHEETSTQVEARYFRLLHAIEKDPLVFYRDNKGVVITKKHLHYATYLFLNQPYRYMKQFFEALKALEERNGAPFYDLSYPLLYPQPSCPCSGSRPWPKRNEEIGVACYCADSSHIENDPAALREYYELMATKSRFADIWSNIRFACVGWKVKPEIDWRGPIGADTTSFPILFIGNSEDPQMPLPYEMTKRFRDSVAVIQNSTGHCSIAATSLCTAKAVRRYFGGFVPENGTVCDVEGNMFMDDGDTISVESEEDLILLEAWRALSAEGLKSHPHAMAL